MNTEKPSVFLWLWIPVAILAAQLVIEFTVPARTYTRLLTENGPHELMQFFILLLAFIVGVRTIVENRGRGKKWLLGWLGLAVLGCFYVGGEEISWGQHFLGWATPEGWQAINDQQETNLHNTSAWLDQKPRLILEIGVIVGGLIFPLIARLRHSWVPAWMAPIAPPSWTAVCAGLFLFVKISGYIDDKILGFVLFKRGSEVQELYLFYFVLLYLLCMRQRLRA